MARATVEVKICGLTNLPDARAALESGADYLGFVLVASSPRGISAAGMMRILDGLGTVRAVAVFVNTDRDEVERIARDAALHAVQIHGDEEAERFRDFPVTVWRAVRFAGQAWQPRPARWAAQRYVVDAAVAGRYGGTGVRADWPAAARLARRYPVMLAGGVTPDNVAEAVRIVQPAGVDVSSGVEIEPGKKDLAKLSAFLYNAKHRDSGRQEQADALPPDFVRGA